MKKVLFIWEVNEELKEYIQAKVKSSLNLVFANKADYEQEAEDAHCIVGWRPTLEMLQSSQELELYINPGAGVEHLAAFQSALRKCKVVNGHGNAFFTAEHIVAMLLSLTNRLVSHHQWMLEGKWRLGDKVAPSISLRNRVVGLLGYGHVNKTVHEMLKPFACEVLILRRNPAIGQYGLQDLHPFLKRIDVLIATLPFTENTEGLIGATELELLGKEGIVVNAGRGKTFDEQALYEALKKKTIHSAAIDVWYNYKAAPDKDGKTYPYSFPFYNLDNILLSPHRAASPFGDLERWDDVIENLNRLAEGRTDFLNEVNLEEGY